MVIDAAGRALRRDELIGHPIAEDAFAICDAIWLQDPRLDELRQGSPRQHG